MLGILGLFLVSMMGGVLALTAKEVGQGTADMLKGIGSGLRQFITELFGVSTESGVSEFFFVVLLAMAIYTVISSFFSSSSALVRWIITISISTLAYLGMPDGYLDALLVSYGAMGLTILTVIPFLIMIIFSINVKNLMIARGTWGFYAIYYLVLVIGRIWEKGDAHPAYWIALIGGGFMFWTIPYVRHMFNKGKLEGYVEKAETAINKNIETHKLANKSREGEVGAAMQEP